MNNKKIFKFIPFFITLVMILICTIFLCNHSFEELLSYTPKNLFLAAFVLLGFYGLKSLSVVFPMYALYIAVGAIYPFWLSFIINIAGLVISFTIPYIIGRISGGELVEKIANHYPKVEKLIDYTHNNNLFASYVSRVLFIPCDIVSMLYGALKMPYRVYILGSLMGLMPEMIVSTYIGARLKNLTFKSILVMIGLILCTFGFSYLLNKKLSNRRANS
ncbi:MAG: TVP38/TMEM64 family protein [Hominimerdicola sp.]